MQVAIKFFYHFFFGQIQNVTQVVKAGKSFTILGLDDFYRTELLIIELFEYYFFDHHFVCYCFCFCLFHIILYYFGLIHFSL